MQPVFARLAAVQADLDARTAELHEASQQLDSRIGSLASTVSQQLDDLSAAGLANNSRLRSIDTRLGLVDKRIGELDATKALTSPLPPPPPTEPAGLAAAPMLESITNLETRLAELRTQIEDLSERTASIDTRVTSVSVELANQFDELSRDLDELGRRADDPLGGRAEGAVDTAELEARIAARLDTAIDDVLDATERLATEQARYEIQFRADLAELAERLRRPGNS
jgi:chromosome segregation ATPase